MCSENHRELGEEYPPEGEDNLIEQVLAMTIDSMEDEDPVLRDQHPKSHGYLEGSFTIEDDISEELGFGIFGKEKPKNYPIWVRFSNGSNRRDDNGNLLSDTVGDIRGMAIKLMNVEGEKATDIAARQNEQDFILINSPIMFVKDVQGYIDLFPVLDAIREGEITFNSDGSRNVPPHLQPQFQAIAYAFPILNEIRAKQTNSPLEIPYWSATPYKLGKGAMKYSVVPHPVEKGFNSEDAEDKDNYLREAIVERLEKNENISFDFKIQIQKDANSMPIEDPTIEWDEKKSPFIKVATIEIPAQNFNTPEIQELDKRQSFSPWYCLKEHRPLGGVNRARKIYAEVAEFRNNIDN